MRVNLITKSSSQIKPGTASMPLSLKIRPACGIPGDYEYSTDSTSLIRMLHRQTDLPASVIERFEERMHSAFHAHLLGVELSENVLTEIGYFID
jgi:hypothetical protein